MAEMSLSSVEWRDVEWLLNQSDFDDMPPVEIPSKPKPKTNDVPVTTESDVRFVSYTREEATDFINSMENESTRKKTDSDMRQFRSYLDFKGEKREIENISVVELDTYFGNFIIGARKSKDRAEYEPSTLRGFMSSLDRYLKRKGWTYGVINNPIFPHSNAALTAKQKELKKQGLGNRPNESDELTDADVELLFQKKIIGLHSPEAVINLLHLNFSLVLGMRGGKEQRQLMWGDLEVGVDEDGDEYLVHKKERSTKTRTGENVRNIRQFKPKAWKNAIGDRCPVNAYKLYAEKRPSDMLKAESPFFLGINVRNPVNDDQAWFKSCPMGVNTIYGLTKKMWSKCKGSDADDRKITNHSVRKHLVQKCVDLNLPPTETIQISGHKNLQSINNYSKMNVQKQKKVATALSNSCKKSSAAALWNVEPTPVVCSAPAILEANSAPVFGQVAATKNLSYSQQAMSSVFGSHTTISGGNFYFGTPQQSHRTSSSQSFHSPPTKKFRRILPIMDSDDDDFQ